MAAVCSGQTGRKFYYVDQGVIYLLPAHWAAKAYDRDFAQWYSIRLARRKIEENISLLGKLISPR